MSDEYFWETACGDYPASVLKQLIDKYVDDAITDEQAGAVLKPAMEFLRGRETGEQER